MGIFGFGVFQYLEDNNNLAKVGKESIEVNDYLNYYNYSVRNRENLTAKEESQYRQQAFFTLISLSLIEQDAKASGIQISNYEIQDAIRENVAFISTEGNFDYEAYQLFLDRNNFSPKIYEENLRSELIRNQYIDLFSSIGELSEPLYNYYTSYYNRKANVKYFPIPTSLWKTVVTSDEKVLRGFYNNNFTAYRNESGFAIAWFFLPKEKTNLNVDKGSVNSYLARNQEDYVQKEKFKSKHILLSLENANFSLDIKNKIEDIYQQLLKDESKFEALAKKHSEDPTTKNQGGDLGWMEYGTFVDEFDEVVRGLEIGKISKPFLTEFGYHIVYLEDKKESVFDKEKAQIEIKDKLERRQLANYASNILNVLEESKSYDFLAENIEREEAIEYYNLEYTSYTIFEDTTIDNEGVEVIFQNLSQYTANNPEFKDGEPYLNFQVRNNGIAIFQLLDIVQGNKIPFNQVKKQVKADYTENINHIKANQQIASLSQKYKQKEDFAKTVKEWKVRKRNIQSKELLFAFPVAEEITERIKSIVFQRNIPNLFFFYHDENIYEVLLESIENDASLDANLVSRNQIQETKKFSAIDKYLIESSKNIKIDRNTKLLKEYNITR